MSSEGERRKLGHRLAMARRFLNAADDEITKERLEELIRAYRPLRHDRRFSEASSFQIGVLCDRRIASSGKLAHVLQRLHFSR
jgi:hypothetical protein